MARRIFEFECDNGHITERFIEESARMTNCSVCGLVASRIMSAVRSAIDPISGDFPGATMKWERQHVEAARVAKKRYESHNKD